MVQFPDDLVPQVDKLRNAVINDASLSSRQLFEPAQMADGTNDGENSNHTINEEGSPDLHVEETILMKRRRIEAPAISMELETP